MTPQRQIYLANIGTKERIIRDFIKKEKNWVSNCKQSLKNVKSKPPEEKTEIWECVICKELKVAIKTSQYVIAALRKELNRDRIKGVPVVEMFAELGDNSLYCKACGNTVWHEGQGYVVKYCDECGRKLDFSAFV